MRRILIVDDEPHIRALLTRQLDNQGFETEVAANGADALEQLRQGSFDAVVTDFSMPGLSGEELCERIRGEIGEQVPLIVVMTSHLREELGGWVDSLPNAEFFQKPLSLRKLSAVLRKHFSSEGDAG